MRTTVVVPTYNERENIGPLLDALLALPVPDLSVLVVDDNSPDGTGKYVHAVATREPRIRLLEQPTKSGLGGAYLAGFRSLLTSASPPEYVVQMDADFSHNPSDIPRLLHALQGTDVAIGSRYVPGGSVLNWSWLRRFLSAGGNLYARTLLGLQIRDVTAGFCAWRTSILRQIVPAVQHSEGYSFQIELKMLAARHRATCTEVPIVFAERRAGRSKISRAIVWEALVIVPWLRLKQ